MPQMNKTPLKQRLQQVISMESNPLTIFDVFIEDYFMGLSSVSGDSYFMNMYHNVISNERPLNEIDFFLASVPQALDTLPEVERLSLLLEILVKPFARLHEQEESL